MPTETPPALKKQNKKTFKARTEHNKLQQKKKTSPVTGSEAAPFRPASKNGFGDSYELEY